MDLKVRLICQLLFTRSRMNCDFGNHLLYNQHYMNQYQWGSDSGDPDPQGAYITFKGLQFGLWVRGKKLLSPFFQIFVKCLFCFSSSGYIESPPLMIKETPNGTYSFIVHSQRFCLMC